MKYTDLTKDQQEHFDNLLKEHGPIPTGTTHFDMEDSSPSSFLKFIGYTWLFWDDKGKRFEYFDEIRENYSIKPVPIPNKPWCCQDDNNPAGVALTAKPKVRKIVYDRKAFNTAINWILNNNPYAKEDWKNTLPLDVRRWMKELIKRYDDGEIDGVSYISSAGLTLISSWESDDVLHFDLFADVNIEVGCGEYEYDVEDVF